MGREKGEREGCERERARAPKGREREDKREGVRGRERGEEREEKEDRDRELRPLLRCVF